MTEHEWSALIIPRLERSNLLIHKLFCSSNVFSADRAVSSIPFRSMKMLLHLKIHFAIKMERGGPIFAM